MILQCMGSSKEALDCGGDTCSVKTMAIRFPSDHGDGPTPARMVTVLDRHRKCRAWGEHWNVHRATRRRRSQEGQDSIFSAVLIVKLLQRLWLLREVWRVSATVQGGEERPVVVQGGEGSQWRSQRLKCVVATEMDIVGDRAIPFRLRSSIASFPVLFAQALIFVVWSTAPFLSIFLRLFPLVVCTVLLFRLEPFPTALVKYFLGDNILLCGRCPSNC